MARLVLCDGRQLRLVFLADCSAGRASAGTADGSGNGGGVTQKDAPAPIPSAAIARGAAVAAAAAACQATFAFLAHDSSVLASSEQLLYG